MRPLHLALGAAALLGLAFSRGGGGSPPPALPRAGRSRRLFTGQLKSDLITFNLVNGEVQESPEMVAQALSRALKTTIPVGTVALASMLDSESGGTPDKIREA